MSSMPKQKRGESRQDYGTPPELLDAIRKRLGIANFVIDLAASDEAHVCKPYITEAEDSLMVDWPKTYGDWAWLNPPYANIAPWVEKAARSADNGTQTAMLVPASVGANWFLEWVEGYAYKSFLNGRITFVGETTPYPKDCMLLLYTTWGFLGSEVWNWGGK